MGDLEISPNTALIVNHGKVNEPTALIFNGDGYKSRRTPATLIDSMNHLTDNTRPKLWGQTNTL